MRSWIVPWQQGGAKAALNLRRCFSIDAGSRIESHLISEGAVSDKMSGSP